MYIRLKNYQGHVNDEKILRYMKSIGQWLQLGAKITIEDITFMSEILVEHSNHTSANKYVVCKVWSTQ